MDVDADVEVPDLPACAAAIFAWIAASCGSSAAVPGSGVSVVAVGVVVGGVALAFAVSGAPLAALFAEPCEVGAAPVLLPAGVEAGLVPAEEDGAAGAEGVAGPEELAWAGGEGGEEGGDGAFDGAGGAGGCDGGVVASSRAEKPLPPLLVAGGGE